MSSRSCPCQVAVFGVDLTAVGLFATIKTGPPFDAAPFEVIYYVGLASFDTAATVHPGASGLAPFHGSEAPVGD